ncbi:MAG: VOC family protein [Solirubrobacteraceae bacterium]
MSGSAPRSCSSCRSASFSYLDLGNAWLQLVQPLDSGHPLASGLRTHREGLHHICFGVDDVESELQRIGPPGIPVPPLGSGRGRPAGFPAGEPLHGVRIECTVFDRRADVEDVAGMLDDRVKSGRSDAGAYDG